MTTLSTAKLITLLMIISGIYLFQKDFQSVKGHQSCCDCGVLLFADI